MPESNNTKNENKSKNGNENKSKDESVCKEVSQSVSLMVPSDIPESEIKLTQLEDGYKIEGSHSTSHKDDKCKSETCQTFFSEHHYGRKVKEVKGTLKEGKYDVCVIFEE